MNINDRMLAKGMLDLKLKNKNEAKKLLLIENQVFKIIPNLNFFLVTWKKKILFKI